MRLSKGRERNMALRARICLIGSTFLVVCGALQGIGPDESWIAGDHVCANSQRNQASGSANSQGQKDILTTGKTIKVDVNLVTVPVVVTDREGRCVTGLQLADFHVFEEGVAQRIDRVVPGVEAFHVALLMDSSGSTQFKHEELQKSAIAFVEALRPQDRVLVASFDTAITFHSEFTDDRGRLRKAIGNIHTTESRTSLYDALDILIQKRLDPLSGRKAIVLFTDGVDNASERFNRSSIVSRVEKSDVVVYPVQYDTRSDGMPDRFSLPPLQGQITFDKLYDRAVVFLRDLAARSGGLPFQATTLERLENAFARIAEELPLQYALCYYPTKPARAGSFRRIRVTVDRAGVQVRARQGYRIAEKRQK